MGCERGYYQSTTEQTRVFNGQGVSERFPMCKPCPMGFYEDRVGSTGCIPCPEYYRTNSTGAKSVKECFGKLHFRFPLGVLLNLHNAAGLQSKHKSVVYKII